MEEKITILPYAGPEVMGNQWNNSIKSHSAGKKVGSQFVPIYNPVGMSGNRTTKKEKENE